MSKEKYNRFLMIPEEINWRACNTCKFNTGKDVCEKYEKGIPNSIYLDEVNCEYFVKNDENK